MPFYSLHFHEIDSTNNYLKNSCRVLDSFTFVSADYQSLGKGRNNRVWTSDSGKNLLFSFLIKEHSLIDNYSIISILTAIEIARFLEQYDIKNVSIKWPNDVLVGDKKICGILSESQLPEYIVVGVGLNVNQKLFSNDLRRPATSMSIIVKKDFDIEDLKERLFSNIVNALSDLKLDERLTFFKKHNYLQNKRVRVLINDQPFIGEVMGIDDSFCLQILSNDMLLHIDSGEIEIL